MPAAQIGGPHASSNQSGRKRYRMPTYPHGSTPSEEYFHSCRNERLAAEVHAPCEWKVAGQKFAGRHGRTPE